ncbi:flagellar hook protein FlgE [Phenylobacterium sp.]|uniref:flagellar hook protein FlgE n=1 Tax=Phenylobacterium sp. TaxID=1871053 RepID=UPI002810D3FD|nr:flagellar hook protein FlgE [Phenylobacterium sp.]
MSINSAMLAGVSGLVANSSALAAISDNIANVNTVAYKRNQVNFANVVTAQAVKGKYSAGGVQSVTRQFVSQQGLIQASGSTTDLAISGDGFFVVTNKGAGLTAADARSFTRSGSFGVDADGYLVNDANLYLQGWPIQADGTFNVNPSDLTEMASINVKNLGAAVEATTDVSVTANVNKSGPVSTGLGTYNTAANSMAAYAASNGASGTKPDFVIEMNVIDSAGGSRKVAMAMLKDTVANTWRAEIYAVPATDVDAGANGQLATGNVVFNADGTINMAGTSNALKSLTLNASSGAAPRWAPGLGLAAQTVDIDLAKLTQYSAASTVNSIQSNGAGVGNVIAIDVDENGIVSAVYDNSQIRRIAKIGVATFPNVNALASVSGNAYRPTIQAGEMTIKEAGIGGAGFISPSSLEASTVDLSAEFTGLIATQKAYSASSKIITTADQMLEELINIKR